MNLDVKDIIAAVENQRTAALTDNARLYAELQAALRRVAELETKLAELSPKEAAPSAPG